MSEAMKAFGRIKATPDQRIDAIVNGWADKIAGDRGNSRRNAGDGPHLCRDESFLMTRMLTEKVMGTSPGLVKAVCAASGSEQRRPAGAHSVVVAGVVNQPSPPSKKKPSARPGFSLRSPSDPREMDAAVAGHKSGLGAVPQERPKPLLAWLSAAKNTRRPAVSRFSPYDALLNTGG